MNALYPAVVVDNNDPEQRGRLRVTCRALFADGVEIPEWVPPVFPVTGKETGWFAVPPIGSTVLLDMNDGSEEDEYYGASALTTPDYRWIGGAYGKPADVPKRFTGAGYAQKFGYVSPGGLCVVFDDLASTAMFGEAKEENPLCVIVDGKNTKVLLGREMATNPVPLGDILQSIVSSLITAIETQHGTHTHTAPPGGGATSPPVVPMDLSANKAQVDGDTWLSSIVFAKKT